MMDAAVGQTLGGYRLERVLRQSRTGLVFAAAHVLSGRQVTVEVLRDRLAWDRAAVARFFSETSALSELGHPALIEIIDFITVESPRRAAVVKEIVAGETLDEILRSGPLSIAQAIHLALQLIDLLRVVHRAGFLHRDLRTASILVLAMPDAPLPQTSRIKVLDFGSAMFGHGASWELDVSDRPGPIASRASPVYLAPEQIAGERVGPEADVYAVAAILHEMIDGRPAFEGSVREVLLSKLGRRRRRLPLPVRFGARRRLSRLIAAALENTPTRRPSLEQMERGLLEILGPPRPTVGPSAEIAESSLDLITPEHETPRAFPGTTARLASRPHVRGRRSALPAAANPPMNQLLGGNQLLGDGRSSPEPSAPSDPTAPWLKPSHHRPSSSSIAGSEHAEPPPSSETTPSQVLSQSQVRSQSQGRSRSRSQSRSRTHAKLILLAAIPAVAGITTALAVVFLGPPLDVRPIVDRQTAEEKVPPTIEQDLGGTEVRPGSRDLVPSNANVVAVEGLGPRTRETDGRSAEIDDRSAEIDDRWTEIDDRWAEIDRGAAEIDGRTNKADPILPAPPDTNTSEAHRPDTLVASPRPTARPVPQDRSSPGERRPVAGEGPRVRGKKPGRTAAVAREPGVSPVDTRNPVSAKNHAGTGGLLPERELLPW